MIMKITLAKLKLIWRIKVLDVCKQTVLYSIKFIINEKLKMSPYCKVHKPENRRKESSRPG